MFKRSGKKPVRPDWSAIGNGHSGSGVASGPTFVEISEIDGWRSRGHAMAPPPDRELVRRRIESEVGSLDGAIDEGTAAALDRLIESWVAQWLATVDTEYIDACAVVDVHYGRAAQALTDAETHLEFLDAELTRLQEVRDEAADRLRGRKEDFDDHR